MATRFARSREFHKSILAVSRTCLKPVNSNAEAMLHAGRNFSSTAYSGPLLPSPTPDHSAPQTRHSAPPGQFRQLSSTVNYSDGGTTYATSLAGYHAAMTHLTRVKKNHMLREVYSDLLMDGFTPDRDTYHIVIPGLMRAKMLQDSLFFLQEMKDRGVKPDMAKDAEALGFTPLMRTYVALLNACGAAGRVDDAMEVVERMERQKLPLNRFGYAALIAAHKNRRPTQKGVVMRIMNLLEQSLAIPGSDTWGEEDGSEDGGGGGESGSSSSSEYVCFHAAASAMLELREPKALDMVEEMVKAQGLKPDHVLYALQARANAAGLLMDKALLAFERYKEVAPALRIEVYAAVIEGCIKKHTAEGVEAAKKLLVDLKDNGLFLNFKFGGLLLFYATMSKDNVHANLSVATMIWEMLSQDQKPTAQFSFQYLRALQTCKVPDSDPRVDSVLSFLKIGPYHTSSNQSGTQPSHQQSGEGTRAEEATSSDEISEESKEEVVDS